MLRFRRALLPALRGKFELKRVVYDPELQRKAVRVIIETSIEASRRADERSATGRLTVPLYVKTFLHEQLTSLAMSFKNKAFSGELEWRLCFASTSRGDEAVSFRVSRHGLTPFVEFFEQHPDTGKRFNLPITDVIYGYAQDTELSPYALEALLKANGYD